MMRKSVLMFFAFVSTISVQADYFEQDSDNGKKINTSTPRQQNHPQELELTIQNQKITIITFEKARRQKSVLYYLTRHKGKTPWRHSFVIKCLLN